ncbi:MAG: S-layer homology domain-containing protein [Faecousia sp.]
MEETEQQPEYAPTDVVRVSIVMEKKSTLEAGFSTENIDLNAQAMSYRDGLRDEQTEMTARIEKAVGSKLDVQWNLTLAANIISANVAYGDIEAIEAVPGVQEVVLETRYEPCVVDEAGTADPNMATSRHMIGTASAYAAGYTGAGTRVAIIDTGLDMDHQCFDAEAFEYSLSQLDGEYDLLDTADIAAVLDQLNAKERTPSLTAEKLYKTSKIPYGYNYIDKTASYVDHDKDIQGGHGSHVAGIAVANDYVSNGDGTFSPALETTKMQGVAPDAQIVVMKVFGKAGGAYDSDYMVAIEDAVILGCASVNLSLGSANAGFTRSAKYQQIMDNLEACGTTVAISAGNAGHWAQASQLPLTGYLYGDDVSTHTGGSPGTFTNSLCVASVDNAGSTTICFHVADKSITYMESEYSNKKLLTLAGEQDYIFIDGLGKEEDFAPLADVLKGKVAICSRGENSFYQKAENAVKYGTIATIIYNNVPGPMGMDLSSYHPYTDYVIDAGLMNGVGNSKFNPNGETTRAMLVTTLYRMAGEPEVSEKSTFTDVPADQWYASAIAWAQDVGVANGVTETVFCPDALVTREQAAAFLYRYVTEYLKAEPVKGADLSAYKDADSTSVYAREAIAWATAEGIFQSYPDGTLQPKGHLIRIEMAKILTVLDQKF